MVRETNRYAQKKLANTRIRLDKWQDVTAQELCAYDRLFKVRPILDNISEKIQNVFEPSKNLSIDEGMIAFKGRLSFRQYMPAKPTKYGIKVSMAADSSNG